MPFALIAAFVAAAVYSAAAAVATAIAFVLAHPFLTAAIIASAVALRNLAKPKTGGPDAAAYRRSEPRAATPARWIYGRARVGGVPVHVSERRVGRYKHLYLVYALSEGEIEGIEAVYLNGKRMPTVANAHTLDVIEPSTTAATARRTELGTRHLIDRDATAGATAFTSWLTGERARLQEEVTGQQWVFAGTPLISLYLHRGEASSPLNTHADFAESESGWSAAHQMRGISGVGVVIRATKNEQYWRGIPNLEFVVRGVRITEPDAAAAAWTENAASVRRHWLINVRGLDADKIDLDTYYAARTECGLSHEVPAVSIGDDGDADKAIHASDVLGAVFGDDESAWPAASERQKVIDTWNERHAGAANAEIRYSVNGVIDADLDDREVEDRMDFAWAGHAVEWSGKVRFYPGRETTADLTIGEDDVIASSPPSWQIEPRLEEKVSSLVAVVPQSAQHDWLEYSMPRIARAGEDDVAPVDLGTLALVAYPRTASRLMKIHLARANGGRTGTMTLTRGSNWEHFGIYPTRRVSVDMPSEGLTAPNRFFVLSAEFDFAGTVSLEVQQEEVGGYLGAADIPLGWEDEGGYLPGVGLQVAPPESVRMAERQISETPAVYSVYYVVADDDPEGDDIDRDYLQARVRTAAGGGEDAGPWNISAVGQGVTFFASSPTGYDYQVRWVYPWGSTGWAAQQALGHSSQLPTPTGYGV